MKIRLHNIFYLLSIELLWSYYPSCRLGQLTWIFLSFFSWIFFSILSINIELIGIRLHICFSLRFMKLFWSHDVSHEFNRLTQVVFCVDFFLFYHLILNLLGVDLHNLISIFFVWGYPDFIIQIWQVNRGWLDSFF